jgi:hypothetical protein
MVFNNFARNEPLKASALKTIHIFFQQDGNRRALFAAGVCSASAIAVSPELRALVAVTAGARFLRNKRTSFQVR